MAARVAFDRVRSPRAGFAGFFDRLFGDIRRAVEPSRCAANRFRGPVLQLGQRHFNPQQEQLRSESSGPSAAFCVPHLRLAAVFPSPGRTPASARRACRSFCPASETKLYGGSNIETASAGDGSRYSDLPNAFVYRKAMVAGCTCNGKSAVRSGASRRH